ncbi:hypothetical protein D9Q98_002128 [Chlorella vulgaris]|uniref:DUF4200 domain-containing protein n=1 Tax=Chlorella vulgaris TaxID=3077 RepID=A0A9D4TW91_CHLVU|nr:hypothetical protein D9Q98_002128 [Chlorella vulgaris]
MAEVARQSPLPPSAPAQGIENAQPPAPARAPIHQRHTATSRLHALVDPFSKSAAEIKALLRDREQRPVGSQLPQLGAAGVHEYARRRGESMRDLVMRKREIFLAQMGLDTKHSEIAKLEQRTRNWEDALVASEAALEADSQRFEQYLKDNDAKLQEALRRADVEAHARADKAGEAKQLAAAIAAIKGETSKIEEQLQECQRLKAFLDSVTPEDWFEALAATRAQKKAALRAAWQAECDAASARKQDAAAARQRAEHDVQCARTQQQYERAEQAHREAVALLRAVLAEPAPEEPDYAAVDAEGAEQALHFREPAQLLAVFSQLEGSNMFQIQTAQDAEAGLEAARAEHSVTTAALDAQAGELQRQLNELQASVASNRERCAHLQSAALESAPVGSSGESSAPAPGGAPAPSSSTQQQQQQQAQQQPYGLAALAEAVAAAYEAAGFTQDASVTSMQMLQKLEERLEECLAAVGPPTGPTALLAEQVERAREKERRQAARSGKLAEQVAEHEARVARVLSRAAAPRLQRGGKPAMTRSVLHKAEVEGVRERGTDGEEELAAFLSIVDEALDDSA